MKFVVVVMLFAIVGSLGKALYAMAAGDASGAMVRALTWRIGLSLGLFILLKLGGYCGWIEPIHIQ